ncbi:choice-of-anchor B family protein [Gilvibacter sp.]|uniref:choice-of-anchor B family protein n=1 Tax=Gilvibacter sp. TaxID=2729997 RepID=UPI003F4A0C1A
MKKTLLALLFISTNLVMGQIPCESGSADGFPCEGLDLMDRIPLADFDASLANDNWGWTDPETGGEYAIIGLSNGTAFVDVTDPLDVVYLGKLPTFTDPSIWRDIKVYDNHAFIVSEADGHGMQVFDLTRLRTVSSPPVTFDEDAHYSGFGSAHNIAINEDTGFAYAIGTDTFSGGIHMVNIQSPLSPQFAGGYADSGYTHDAQIVTYSGPDGTHTGKELFFGSNEDVVVIVDVTDKDNPILLSAVNYSDIGYTHQGWLTEDQRYFLLADEVDEIIFGFETKTIIFDVSDIDNPEFAFNYFSQNPSTDHNGYVVGDQFYLASYRAGLRILDLTGIDSGTIVESHYFDTWPSSDNAGTGNGSWNVYPFFESGNIVVSDQDNGFFLVRDNSVLSTVDQEILEAMAYPNPMQEQLTVQYGAPIEHVQIFNLTGQLVKDLEFTNGLDAINIDVSGLSAGFYVLQVNDAAVQKLMKR